MEHSAVPPGAGQRKAGCGQPAGPDHRGSRLRAALGVALAHPGAIAHGPARRAGREGSRTPGRLDRHAYHDGRGAGPGMEGGRRPHGHPPAGNQRHAGLDGRRRRHPQRGASPLAGDRVDPP
ncbi:hypothetical protein G6F68_017308 [Rhizopus microsporus]|nr:hypothetical protein G6F68_017308 [Rhizopus microsporus]